MTEEALRIIEQKMDETLSIGHLCLWRVRGRILDELVPGGAYPERYKHLLPRYQLTKWFWSEKAWGLE